MKIYLIGMPGSGKTTLGRPLADALALPFVDQDVEIENREGASVQEIFAQKGEDHFRRAEADVLREWAASAKSFVMATGGGAPCFFQGIDAINQTGLSVFLDVPVAELLERLRANKDRPLLHAADAAEREEKLRQLHARRLADYERAHITVAKPTLPKLLEAVRLKMQNRG